MTIKQVKGSAGSLHVNDGGAGGVPVIFVHSFAGDTTHWSAQLEPLRKTRRAVAFDSRGHGQAAPGKVPAEQAQQIMTSLETDYEKTMESYWSQLMTGAQPQVLEKLAVGRRKMSQDRSLSIIKAIFQYDPVPALRSYSGPKLAVITPHGDQPYDLHNLAPGMPHKVVAGASHWLQMDKPEEFNWILDGFLKSVFRPLRESSKE